MMDLAEFEDLLGRLGDDLARWPAPQQDEAAILLRASEPARAALAEARRLRDALRTAPVRAPSGLLDRIMQKARQSDPAKDESKPDDTPPTPPKGSALVLALCLCGGICSGQLEHAATTPPAAALTVAH